jgi:predicted membrane metal-binding protein
MVLTGQGILKSEEGLKSSLCMSGSKKKTHTSSICKNLDIKKSISVLSSPSLVPLSSLSILFKISFCTAVRQILLQMAGQLYYTALALLLPLLFVLLIAHSVNPCSCLVRLAVKRRAYDAWTLVTGTHPFVLIILLLNEIDRIYDQDVL